MRSLVEIIQVSDGTWYLQIMMMDDANVPINNTLIPHKRLIEAIDTACLLQLRIDNEVELPLNQYKRSI